MARFQVNLQGRNCHAATKGQRHDAHVYHIARRSVDAASRDEQCAFFAYFWCEGLGGPELTDITAEPLPEEENASAPGRIGG